MGAAWCLLTNDTRLSGPHNRAGCLSEYLEELLDCGDEVLQFVPAHSKAVLAAVAKRKVGALHPWQAKPPHKSRTL